MLGGSGSHNGNFYNRGSPYDYNNFASITGDDSWSYKNVLKHFKNYERFVGKLVKENERIGWIGISKYSKFIVRKLRNLFQIFMPPEDR